MESSPGAVHDDPSVVILRDGWTPRVQSAGTGTPVVLVHGLGGAVESWTDVSSALEPSHQVISYDLRGARQNSRSSSPVSIDSLAEDLQALISALGLSPAIIVGHSLGGAVGLVLSAHHPGSVKGLVAVAAAVTPTPPQRGMLNGWAEQAVTGGLTELARGMATGGTSPRFRLSKPAQFEALVRLIQQSDPEGYSALAHAVSSMDITTEMAQVEVPVRFVAAALDVVSTPATNQELARSMKVATVVTIEQCGHHVEKERPDELAAAIESFARELQ